MSADNLVLPRAKLCELCKWEDFDGYGFSLHGIKGRIGQFIREVDPDSPAYAGGIRDDDFLVEVNGINVLSEPHMEVVERIKANPDRVCLLVVDREAKEYFAQNRIVVDSHMRDLERFCCPPQRPAVNGHMDVMETAHIENGQAQLLPTDVVDGPHQVDLQGDQPTVEAIRRSSEHSTDQVPISPTPVSPRNLPDNQSDFSDLVAHYELQQAPSEEPMQKVGEDTEIAAISSGVVRESLSVVDNVSQPEECAKGHDAEEPHILGSTEDSQVIPGHECHHRRTPSSVQFVDEPVSVQQSDTAGNVEANNAKQTISHEVAVVHTIVGNNGALTASNAVEPSSHEPACEAFIKPVDDEHFLMNLDLEALKSRLTVSRKKNRFPTASFTSRKLLFDKL